MILGYHATLVHYYNLVWPESVMYLQSGVEWAKVLNRFSPNTDVFV